MKRCPHCNREYPDTEPFCPDCGGLLEEVARTPSEEPSNSKRCPHCGEACPEGAQFCPSCGGRIDASIQREARGVENVAAATDAGLGGSDAGATMANAAPGNSGTAAAGSGTAPGNSGTGAAAAKADRTQGGSDQKRLYTQLIAFIASMVGLLFSCMVPGIYGFLICFFSMLFAVFEGKSKVIKVATVVSTVISAIILLHGMIVG